MSLAAPPAANRREMDDQVRVPSQYTKQKVTANAVTFYLARRKGLEPPTFWFVAKHSIQLSYRRKMERMTRLELATSTLARWRSTR